MDRNIRLISRFPAFLLRCHKGECSNPIRSQRFPTFLLRCHKSEYSNPIRSQSTLNNKDENDIDLDIPLQFSSSRASDYKSFDTFFQVSSRKRPWYEPIIIAGSIAVLLIYFCILREENDVDEDLGKSLYEIFSEMEERQQREQSSSKDDTDSR